VITWDGLTVPCCFDKDAEFRMGNIKETTDFDTVWRSEKYQEFRKQVFTNRKSIEICRNCTEGMKL